MKAQYAKISVWPWSNLRVIHEGSRFCQEDVREVSGHPPPWAGNGDLRQSQTQAKTRLMGAVTRTTALSSLSHQSRSF